MRNLFAAAAVISALAPLVACSGGASRNGDDGSGGGFGAPSNVTGAQATETAAGTGSSSDVGPEPDCGATKATKCEAGKRCASDADCASDACSYAKRCVSSPSCAGRHGGDTCGAGETGAPDAKHESCCTTIAIPDGPDGPFVVDKYLVTAGRMRAFLEKTKGDVRGFIDRTRPAGWDDSWSEGLPRNLDEAHAELGPSGKKGCDVLNQGGRTYDQPPVYGNPGEKSDFDREVLDEKALNCVHWNLGAAFCAFEGKRLVKASEVVHVFTNGGADDYPWGGSDPTSGVINHRYAYATPNPPASLRLVGTGEDAYPLDHAFYVSPPGRFPAGASKAGVADAAGNLLPWVADGPREFVWTHSWESHKANLEVDTSSGYYAIGIRCAHDG
jgi:formylglycine-generating enzyme required for sulfatase activity